MPIGQRNSDPMVLLASPTNLGPGAGPFYSVSFYNDGFSAMRILIDRDASAGTTATLDAALEWKNQANGEWMNLLDQAGNQVSFVQWAAASNIPKYIDIGQGVGADPDADGVLVYGNFKAYDIVVPFEMRVKFTVGNADNTNTLNAVVEALVAA